MIRTATVWSWKADAVAVLLLVEGMDANRICFEGRKMDFVKSQWKGCFPKYSKQFLNRYCNTNKIFRGERVK